MIRLENITKIYEKHGQTLRALEDVNLHVPKGDFLAITGPSGSGKTTLMNILGCLDRPTGGTYLLEGTTVEGLGGAAAAHIRNRKIGFIFQSFNLIGSMSALENVELPLVLRGESRKSRRQKALEALERVGLQARAGHRPAELSGGQQQRVAIARVLAAQPPLILADEPTGNLDGVTSREILSILQQLHGEGQTIVMITHDEGIAAAAPRQMRMEQGRLFTLETN
ncbi:MAG: ABC transporter ATP-binding protein [Clostridia bacterium]|nr:ABC transporter ATP-binding protein [Clostridia bacterium]